MKIISWNIACLPYYFNFFSNPHKRIDMIISTILSFEADIICLQEVLDNEILYKIENKLKKKHYKICKSENKIENTCFNYFRNLFKPCNNDSGLLIASKLNFNFIKFIQYDDYIGEDSLISKGIQVLSIDNIKIYNTHIQADKPIFDFNKNAEKIIRKQIDQLLNIISKDDKNILIGDFNLYKNSNLFNYSINSIKKKGNTNINGKELDYIILNNYDKKTNYFLHEYNELSDHPLLICNLE